MSADDKAKRARSEDHMIGLRSTRSYAWMSTHHEKIPMVDEEWLDMYHKIIDYAKNSTIVDDGILIETLRQLEQHAVVQKAISSYHEWVEKTRSVQTFEKCTVRTEWSLNTDMDGVWVHHHVIQSAPITPMKGPPLFAPSFEEWMYKGTMFDLVFNGARGRHSMRATIRLHAYGSVEKRGASRVATNVFLGKDFVVDSG
jgi:hypothetical protein